MINDNVIGVIIAGAVRHAADYAPLIVKHPQLTLLGIVEELNSESWKIDMAKKLARKLDLPFYNLESGLDLVNCNLVLINTEPTRHASVAKLALMAGKNVLVDKPVATCRSEAEELANLAEDTGLIATYFHRLFSPETQRLHNAIANGSIGLPLTLDLTWISNNSLDDEGGDIIIDKAISGGGEIRNFLGYPLDLALWLTGLKPLSLFANSTFRTASEHAKFGVENLATIVLQFESEVRVSITVGRGAPVGKGIFTSTISGSHGYISVKENRTGFEITSAPNSFSAFSSNRDDSFSLNFNSLLNNLIESIKGGENLLRSLSDGCYLAYIIDCACESATTQRTVLIR